MKSFVVFAALICYTLCAITAPVAGSNMKISENVTVAWVDTDFVTPTVRIKMEVPADTDFAKLMSKSLVSVCTDNNGTATIDYIPGGYKLMEMVPMVGPMIQGLFTQQVENEPEADRTLTLTVEECVAVPTTSQTVTYVVSHGAWSIVSLGAIVLLVALLL